MKRRIRVLFAALALGAGLLSTPATADAGMSTLAGGPALFVGFDIGHEYLSDVDHATAANTGSWLLGASAKAFLPAGFGVGASYFQTHHLDEDGRDGNFESVINGGMLDLLVQIGGWDDDTKEFLSLHFGGLDDSPRGDARASAGSYLVGAGIGTTFISRREGFGMAMSAEFRYLLAPDADIAHSLFQGLISIGFGIR